MTSDSTLITSSELQGWRSNLRITEIHERIGGSSSIERGFEFGQIAVKGQSFAPTAAGVQCDVNYDILEGWEKMKIL